MREINLFIDGHYQPAASGRRFEVRNPTNGEAIASVAEAGAEDVDKAVAAARRALEGPWGQMPVNERLARPGRSMWAWPDTFWTTFVPRLHELGYMSDDEVRAFQTDWAEACADEDSFFFLPPVFDVIGVKRG